MENTSISSLGKQGHTLAGTANEKGEDLRSNAIPAINRATEQARTIAKQGIDAVSDALSQARDAASDASDSIVAYTKENPVKALAIAAASGALLYFVINALKPARD